MSAVYNATVQGFYLSYYGRPADPAGLTFWTGQLASAGGNLSSILNAFGTSAEATRRYGTGTDASKIEAIYQQTFGRAADATGLAFYQTELAAGRITLIDISKRVIDGATGDDVTIRANRLSAAQTFTDKLDTDAEKAGYSGSGAEDAARAWITTVTKDAATVTAAAASADATITGLLPATFALTVNSDTFTGGGGNDTITGASSALSASNSLGALDKIDGGAGSDQLQVSMGASFAGFSGGGFLKNVETIKVTTSVAGTEFAAKGATDVKTYEVTGRTNLASLDSSSTTVNYSSVASGAYSVKFIDEATTGSSTKFTLGVSGHGSISGSTVTAPNVDVPGIELLTINSSGTATNYLDIISTGVTSLTASGAAALRIGGTSSHVASGIKTVDATAMTAAFDVDLQQSTSATSVKTGTGNDIIRIDEAALTATATVDGGTGTDTLRIDGTASAPTYALKMTGVETVRVGAVSHSITFSGSDSTGISTIEIGNTAVAGSTATFSGMGATANALIEADLPGGTARAHILAVENTGAATLGVKKSSAAVSASTTETVTDQAVFTRATSLIVDVPEFTDWNATSTIRADKATSLTVSGKGDFGDTGAVITIQGPSLTSLTLDQQSASNDWFVEYDDDSTTLGTQSSGTITNTASPLKSLSVTQVSTSGMNFGTVADLVQSLQSVTIANSGAISFGASNLAAASGVSLTGTGTSASFTAGTLGADSLAYDLSLTGSGQANGLTVDDLRVGEGRTITLNLGSVTGTTDIGDVRVADSSSGAYTGVISINASGHGAKSTPGTLTVAGSGESIQGGAVSIDVTGAKGAVTLGSNGIVGNSVSILASTAESTVTLGTITAKNSLTFEAPAAKATTQSVTIGSGSTAFTGSLKGSIGDDAFTFTSARTTQTSIALTGDLRDGSNTLTVTSTLSTASGGQTIDISGLSNVTSSTVRGAYATKNTLTGGAGDDILYGGAKADVYLGGAGKDTFALNNSADTGNVTIADLQTSSKFAASKSVSTLDLDVIRDFGANDKLSIAGQDPASATFTRATYGTTDYTATTGLLLSGTYSSSGNTFTTSSTGADSMYLYSGSQSTTARAIVLVGFTTSFTADTAAGASGLVGTTT